MTECEFHDMGLDDRILKAIADLGWLHPTPIQERAIPLLLEGKDVIARARTGSGKSGAFILPVIHKILMSKQKTKKQITRALILTPTKELATQAQRFIVALSSSCSRHIKSVDISDQVPLSEQRVMLAAVPDIVVGTPSRLLQHVTAGNVSISDTLEYVVIDEADLVFSFGYENDMKALLRYLPNIYQACLTSATLSDDVKSIKRLLLHNPVVLKLEEGDLPSDSQLTQYLIQCEDKEKFVVIYALFKLELVKGRCIIFVNSVDQSYRLKLFLEQFGIRSCILNSALPLATRCHVIDQFNQGRYDIVIASDESDALEMKQPPPKPEPTPTQKKSRRPKRRKTDSEYGVARGIDFEFVSNIINFDFPLKPNSYIHRVGRTARGDNRGTALSFVSLHELPILEKVRAKLATAYPNGHDDVLKKFEFKMNEIKGFCYRAEDALSRVTRKTVREARLREIKQELLNSQRLKIHFEENQRDMEILQHDKKAKVIRSQPGLKHLPDYLIPMSLKRKKTEITSEEKPKKIRKNPADGKNPKSHWHNRKKRKLQSSKTSIDPLKSFSLTR